MTKTDTKNLEGRSVGRSVAMNAVTVVMTVGMNAVTAGGIEIEIAIEMVTGTAIATGIVGGGGAGHEIVVHHLNRTTIDGDASYQRP